MQRPFSRMMDSATVGPAAAPAASAATTAAVARIPAPAFPDPEGDDVQYPMNAAAQAMVGPLAAELGPGARGERRAMILERAVFAATSSVRIDVSAMEAAISVMKDTLVALKTKLDFNIQLSQQTMERLAGVEKTVLDCIKNAVALGQLGSAGVEDDETTHKENLLKLVTV